MSAVESDRVQDVVEHRASVTVLPGGAVVEPKPKRAAQLGELVCPPDLWSERRPSLRDVYLYGVYGRWTAADGFARWAGAAYATVIVLPLTTALYMAQWVIERPSRLVVAAVLAGLIKLAL